MSGGGVVIGAGRLGVLTCGAGSLLKRVSPDGETGRDTDGGAGVGVGAWLCALGSGTGIPKRCEKSGRIPLLFEGAGLTPVCGSTTAGKCACVVMPGRP